MDRHINTPRPLLVLCLVVCSLGARADTALSELPDPTRPQTWTGDEARPAVNKAAPTLVLQSTLVSGGRRLAVINGETVGPGASVLGAKVLSVTPYEVRVQHGGREISLKLIPSSVVVQHRDKEQEGE